MFEIGVRSFRPWLKSSLDLVKTGEAPALSVADNVKTMALVEAGYRSIDQGRTVKLSEVQIH